VEEQAKEGLRHPKIRGRGQRKWLGRTNGNHRKELFLVLQESRDKPPNSATFGLLIVQHAAFLVKGKTSIGSKNFRIQRNKLWWFFVNNSVENQKNPPDHPAANPRMAQFSAYDFKGGQFNGVQASIQASRSHPASQ
jgi:hypothetical protein